MTLVVLHNFVALTFCCILPPAIRKKSVMNIVAAQEREMWATLGLLRGVFSSRGSGHAFCTPQWIKLMVGIIKKSSVLNSYSSQTKALVQQVLTLRMLRAVLPSWEEGTDTKQQQMLIEGFFSLLGQVLVLCSSPFLKQSMKMGECWLFPPPPRLPPLLPLPSPPLPLPLLLPLSSPSPPSPSPPSPHLSLPSLSLSPLPLSSPSPPI